MFLRKLKIILIYFNFKLNQLLQALLQTLHVQVHDLVLFTFAAFLLYTLQVAMAFALMSALYGDFMQV